MGFWEQLPYTNFHDLNLTELVKFVNETIKKINEMSADIVAQNQAIEDFKTYVMDYLNNLDVEQDVIDYINVLIDNGTISDEIKIAINRVNDWSDRVVLFIGDSYGEGWNNDEGVVTSYQTHMADYLGVTTYYRYNVGGAGFGSGLSHHYGELLEDFITDHGDIADTITDIILCGGYNDFPQTNNYDTDNSTYGMKWCGNYIKTNFKNARVFCGMMARTNLFTASSNLTNITRTFRKYRYGSMINNWTYINHSEIMCHNYNFLSTDGIHLLSTATPSIGQYLAQSILNGDWYQEYLGGIWLKTQHDSANSDFTFTEFGETFSNALSADGVVLKNESETFLRFNDKSMQTHVDYKLCRYSGNSTCRNYMSMLQDFTINVPCSAIKSDNTKYDTTCTLNFGNDGFVYIRLSGVNNSGTGWLTDTYKAIIIYPFIFNIPLDMC